MPLDGFDQVALHLRLQGINPGESLLPAEPVDEFDLDELPVQVAVERDQVRLVVIDSLNGYLNAIPQVEAPLVRMHELLSYLNERGVVTLLVVAQHGIVGALSIEKRSELSK